MGTTTRKPPRNVEVKTDRKVELFPGYKPICRGDDSLVAAGIFVSEHSARWWLRRHRSEAVKAGAVVRLFGQDMADPDKLVAVMADIALRETIAAVS